MLVFKNNGLINIEAITTFGVSSKENNNAIGFFGTGLKYSIAILLREHAKVIIYIGLEKYEFTKETKTVRVNDFEFILMNGTPLAFTTELGKTWQLWQAYRELYCNCQDENGKVTIEANPQPSEGTTTVIVESKELEQIHLNNDDIILNSAPLEVVKGLEIHPRESKFLYYRNIRICELQKPTKFTYNFTRHIELTEDRTAKYSYMVQYEFIRGIFLSKDASIIRKVIINTRDYYEGQLDFDVSGEVSDEFLEISTSLVKTKTPGVPTSIKALVFRRTDIAKNLYEDIKLTKVQEKTKDKALDFLLKLGYDVSEYPIRYVKELNKDCLGQANIIEQRIYISERCFMMGTKMLTGTLLEEYIHLKHHLMDESRDMQNYLFDLVITLGEQVHDISL
jgi:hypothetical protein